MSARVVICGGLGGVGKTTVSAALAVGLAMSGKRVVVLTIDPARRLADALRIEALGNKPTRVPLPDAAGSLDALMLDRKATWDAIVVEHSDDPERARALLDNRYYRAVSTRLTGSHEYMATEKLFELVSSGRWDVVVVDTPPSQHALEFFRAPARIQNLLEGTVMRTLVQPSGGLLGGATRRVAKLVLRMAGKNVLDDIREFFHLFAHLSEGFRTRSIAVDELLHSERTRFFLVTTAAAPDRSDALEFLQEVRDRGMHFDGFLVNRVHAGAGLSRPLTRRDLPEAPPGVDAGDWDALRDALLRLAQASNRTAARQQAAVNRLVSAAGDVAAWTIPDQPDGVRSLEGLVAISQHLPT